MRNTTSKYPTSIDDKIFFQDINLDQLSVMNQYRNYIANQQYTEASNLLNDSDLDFYGAWLMNLFENRLVAIETYLLNKPNVNIVQYNGTAPTKQGANWIS